MSETELLAAPQRSPFQEDASVIMQCSCSGRCSILALDKLNWDDGDEWYAEVFGGPPSLSFREKVKAFWTILRGKEHIYWSMMFSKDQLIKLKLWLNREFPD